MTTGCQFWDREVTEQTHSSWMENPLVREYINRTIGEGQMEWPFDWFQRMFPAVHFPRALSVGCGSGPLERDLIRRGLCDRIDAFDGSVVSLLHARAEAKREGMADRIRYFAWDFNEPLLPRDTYDAVFFHESLHHVAKLEKLLRTVLLSLKPTGLLYLDEMVGPSRTYWNDRTVAPYRRMYQEFPRRFRLFDAMPYPVQYSDPSEAVRSGEIVKQLQVGFEVRHFRGYGGNVLAVFFPALKVAEMTDDFVRELIERERAMIAAGDPPFHAIVVARPKRGSARPIASARYFVEPKLKRIGRELRRLVPFGTRR